MRRAMCWAVVGGVVLTACGDDDVASSPTPPSATGSAGTGAGSSIGGAATTSVGGMGGSTGAQGGSGGGAVAACPPGPFGPPVPSGAAATVVQGGFDFLEGPVWLDATSTLLFTNMRFGDAGPEGWPPATIFELSPPATIDPWLDEHEGGPLGVNGLAVDPEGQLLACTHDERTVSRLDPVTQARTTLAAGYEGAAFNAPNDAIARSDGTIYFTDPTWQLGNRPQEIAFKGVYRLDPQGTVHLVADDFTSPNGVALSPDETVLYVADDTADEVRRYAVAADGSTSGGEIFLDVSGPDGMAMDCAGNLYVAAEAGIVVVAPAGTTVATIPVADRPANCTFGGADHQTLYVTARDTLYEVALDVPGLP